MISDVSLKKTFNRSLMVGLIVKCLLLILKMWSVVSGVPNCETNEDYFTGIYLSENESLFSHYLYTIVNK